MAKESSNEFENTSLNPGEFEQKESESISEVPQFLIEKVLRDLKDILPYLADVVDETGNCNGYRDLNLEEKIESLNQELSSADNEAKHACDIHQSNIVDLLRAVENVCSKETTNALISKLIEYTKSQDSKNIKKKEAALGLLNRFYRSEKLAPMDEE